MDLHCRLLSRTCATPSATEVAYYIDTSALVKLVVREDHTDALMAWIAPGRLLVAADLVRTELIRAVRRSAPDRVVRARVVLGSVTLVTPSVATYEAAGLLDPTPLRSLDALHLASALEFGDELEGLVTYDARLGAAAGSLGMLVVAP